MARPRRIPDDQVFALIRTLLAEGGPRHVTFATVAARSGLAGPSLVQRYLSRDGMVSAALIDGWNRVERATLQATAATPDGPKGAVALLKAIAPSDPALPPSDLRFLICTMTDALTRDRAALWRQSLLGALQTKLGDHGPSRAEMLFALWQGRLLWSHADAATTFRLRDAARLLLAR